MLLLRSIISKMDFYQLGLYKY